MSFYLVGKTLSRDVCIFKVNKTDKGWMQLCLNMKGYDVEYVSDEKMLDLFEWFKCDFSNYRIFQDEQEAMEYHDDKKTVVKNRMK